MRKRILESLRAAIQAIDGEPTYRFDFSDAERVFLYGQHVDTLPSPAVALFARDEAKTRDHAFGYSHVVLTVDAIATIHDGDVRARVDAMSDLAHDIEKAVMVDHTRGGLAIDTIVTATRGVPSEDLDLLAVAVEIQVEYRHRVTDPSSEVT